MPTYQYRCTECGDELEAVQKFTDDPLSVCPVCQGQLRKLFSAVGVVFKGSGFYKTDSRSSKRSASTGTDKKDAPATGSDSSSESKSASSDSGSSGSDSGGSSGSTESGATSSSGSSSSTGDGSKVA
jgi:putative FmdB family regulatory protein